MKKLLLLSAFCLCILGASAQITINTSDVAAVNKVVFQGIDTMPTISIGSAGASQSWNMTALNTHLIDTMTFLAYSSAPNPTFSSANLLMKIGYGNTYVYTNNSSSNLSILGVATTIGASNVNQTYTPPEIAINFPFTFNSNFISNYKTYQKFYFGLFGIDSAKQKSSVKKTVLADAWGNLITPYSASSFPVLRVKETNITFDTTDVLIAGTWYNAFLTGADSTTSYVWWAKTLGFPLVKAIKDSSNAVVRVEWLKGLSAVGISEFVAPVSINVYPNPAQNEVHFTIPTPIDAISIQVFDITGRMVNEHAVKNERSTINTSHFANGIYTYSIIGKNNITLNQGKFTVSK